MPGKCFRGLVSLVYLVSSVLPLAAQQGPSQPIPTPFPVQAVPPGPNQPPAGQTQPSPNQPPVLPRRGPIVPQPGPSAMQPGQPTPTPPGGTADQPAPVPGQAPIPIPPERRMLPPPSAPTAGGGMVSLNFNRADLVEIIHILAQHLRLTYTIDPDVKGIVTIHSAEPLRTDDLLPIFHQILRMNGAVAIRTGNIYRITPIKDAKGLVRPAGQSKEDSFALQIVPVRFFSVAEMKKLLTPFLTPGAELVEYPRGNFLIIMDLPSNIQRLAEIADMIDVQVFAGSRMELYQPKVASAEELAAEMTKVMQAYAASAPQQESFASQFIPLPRINQLLVISYSEGAWTYAKRWLERVDVAGEGPGRRIFIYPVENGKATELAEVLSQALGQPSTGRRDTSRTLQDLHRSTPGGTTGQFGSSSRSSTSSFGSSGSSSQPQQPFGSAFATVPVPGQATPPAAPTPAPTPGLPSVPGAARPATPTAPGAKPEEQLRIVPDPGTNSLIIYGTVQEFQNIKNILKELDIVPRQVLMDVMVAEVTLIDDLKFGVDYEILRKGGDVRIFNREFGSRGGVLTGALPAAAASGLTQFGTGLSGVIGTGNAIRAFINALASDSRVKVLSHPSVLAADNRPARIQVGSEIPILTGQTTTFTTGTTPLTSNAIQYRNTGVILTIIPQVNSQGLVHLQVKQEVSDVGADNFGSTGSPSFTTRDAETTAAVQDGDTLVIGGIITDRKTRDRTGIPYLMNLPIVGRFFGTTTDSFDRTELVMLITPHVIRNRDEGTAVTDEFRNKLFGVRNELERFRLEQEKLKQQRQTTPTPVPDTPPPPPGNPPAGAPTPGKSTPQRPSESGVPPKPSAGLEKSDRSAVALTAASKPKSSPSEPAVSGPKDKRRQDVAIVKELTNQNIVPPPSADQSIPFAALSQPAEALPGLETSQQAAIASAFSIAPSDPMAPFESTISQSPVPTQPATAAANRVTTIAKKNVAADIGYTNSRVWMVQVASVPHEKDADSMANKLRRKGYDAHVFSAEVDSKLRYRVRVGQLASRDEALELQKRLKANEKFADSYVTRLTPQ